MRLKFSVNKNIWFMHLYESRFLRLNLKNIFIYFIIIYQDLYFVNLCKDIELWKVNVVYLQMLKIHSFPRKCPSKKYEIKYFISYNMQAKSPKKLCKMLFVYSVAGFFKQIYLWYGDGEGFAHRFVFLKKKRNFSDCQYCALQTVKIKRSDFPEWFNWHFFSTL